MKQRKPIINKQLREKDARNALLNLYPNEGRHIISQQEYEQKVKEIVKSTYQGEERTLVGYKNSLFALI